MNKIKPNFHLYIDDSGSRRPDHIANPIRRDGMDYFALGGILIHELDIDYLISLHKTFCKKWQITYPLHSRNIRGRRQSFAWLATDLEREKQFLLELENMLLALPTIGFACVIDRKGYKERYDEKYGGKPWLMCKTAFSILVERAAKYVQSQDGTLEIFFEQAGKAEDTDTKNYMKILKKEGQPFNKESSNNYSALSSEDFRNIIKGEPRERTKKFPPIQIADLMLYPIVKGGYDPTYPPYRTLLENGRLIDSLLKIEELEKLGIKYSCFESKNKGSEKSEPLSVRLA